MNDKENYTRQEWLEEGKRRFGNVLTDYRFKCPKCGNVASGKEIKDAGGEPGDMYSCCIGRFVKGRGCDWYAWGLFDICKVHVDGIPVFEFAD